MAWTRVLTVEMERSESEDTCQWGPTGLAHQFNGRVCVCVGGCIGHRKRRDKTEAFGLKN